MKPDWQRDGISLYLGDCLDVLPTLAAGSIDAVATDPPWKDYQTGHYDATGWHLPLAALPPSAYAMMLWRALRFDTGALVWCDWRSFAEHADALAAAGFTIKNAVVWAKSNHTMGDLNGNFGYMHEMAVFALKGKWRRPGKREVNLWRVPHLFTRGHRDHPTEKPVPLLRRSVLALANPPAVVLDPFMGVGTCGEACVAEGYRYIGMEIERQYFDIAVKRIEAALTAKAAELPFNAAHGRRTHKEINCE